MRSEQSLDGRCSVSRRHGDRLQNPQNVASPVCRQRVLFAETEMRVEACATSFWPASPDGVFLAVGAREARPGAPVKHPRKQTCAAQEEIRIPSLVRCSKATARPRKYEPQRAHAVFLWSKRSHASRGSFAPQRFIEGNASQAYGTEGRCCSPDRKQLRRIPGYALAKLRPQGRGLASTEVKRCMNAMPIVPHASLK
jgi:hypothetical protein